LLLLFTQKIFWDNSERNICKTKGPYRL